MKIAKNKGFRLRNPSNLYKNLRKFSIKKRLGKAVIKEFYQRSHEKRSNQSPDSGHQPRQRPYDNAEQVACNPDKFEREPPFLGDNDRNRIIDRDA